MSFKLARVATTVTAILAGALVGCGSDADSSKTTASSSSASIGTNSSAPAPAPAPASGGSPSVADDATVVEINIAAGAVTPTNGQAQGKVGKPIVLKVGSDVPDSLHVHSVPEHTFQVEPRPDQQFEFTVDVPGQVDIELHDLNRTVVTVQVRP